jgi:hypothetical protein
MSVIAMLAILWWGLCGFLAFLAGLLGFLDAIGKTGRAVFFLLVAILGQWLMVRHLDAERRAAEGFVAAWAAESADWPEGRINTREIHEFLDFDRIRTVSPYLAKHYRLRSWSKVRPAGRQTIIADRSGTPVRTEVYLSDVAIHEAENDVDFGARLRVWVATDSDEVADFKFEGIVFE